MYFRGKLGSKEDEDDGEGLEDKAHKAREPVVEGNSLEEPKGNGGLGAPLGVAAEDLAVPLGAALARSFAEGLEAGGDDHSAPGITDSNGRDYEGDTLESKNLRCLLVPPLPGPLLKNWRKMQRARSCGQRCQEIRGSTHWSQRTRNAS